MIFRNILNLILIILAVIFQLSFINNLPGRFNEFNLILVILVIILEISEDKKNIWWFMAVGFIFDIYSLYFFGFFLFFWPLIYLFSKFLFLRFFINRSLYSFLGLSFFTTVSYYFFIYFCSYFLKLFLAEKSGLFLIDKDFYYNMLFSSIFNSLMVLILFYIINFATKKFKPVFLISGKFK